MGGKPECGREDGKNTSAALPSKQAERIRPKYRGTTPSRSDALDGETEKNCGHCGKPIDDWTHLRTVTVIERDIVVNRGPCVDLSRSADLRLPGFVHLLPVRDPS